MKLVVHDVTGHLLNNEEDILMPIIYSDNNEPSKDKTLPKSENNSFTDNEDILLPNIDLK